MINKVILIGYLGADPEIRFIPSDEVVVNISVATTDSWKDKQTGEQRQKTEWHRVAAFGRLGEIIEQYCKKGSKVYIEGKLQTRKWTEKNGIERYSTEIIADQMKMLDSRSSGAKFGNQDHKSTQATNNPAPTTKKTAQAQYEPAGFDSSDIPF